MSKSLSEVVRRQAVLLRAFRLRKDPSSEAAGEWAVLIDEEMGRRHRDWNIWKRAVAERLMEEPELLSDEALGSFPQTLRALDRIYEEAAR